MIRSEQKPVAVIHRILWKFTKECCTVFEPCIGNGATAKACFLEVEHKKFSGRDSDSDCIEKIMPFILETLSGQALSKNSNILDVKDVHLAAKTYLYMLSYDKNARSQDIWKPSTDHSAVQSFQSHLEQFLLPCRLDIELFEKTRHIFCTLWS